MSPVHDDHQLLRHTIFLQRMWILTELVSGEYFSSHNLSHSAWPRRWTTTNWGKTESFLQRYVCVGCQLNSDQAPRLLCVKVHVSSRSSTLWRHRWQEKNEFLCAKTLLLKEFSNPKKDQHPQEMLYQTSYSCERINSEPNDLRSRFLHWATLSTKFLPRFLSVLLSEDHDWVRIRWYSKLIRRNLLNLPLAPGVSLKRKFERAFERMNLLVRRTKCYRSLLQKSPIKEIIFCKRDL